MSNVSNDQIYELLCNVHQSMGALEATGKTTTALLEKHSQDITTIQIKLAGQSGAGRVWKGLGTVMATIAGGAAGGVAGLIKWH